MGGRGFNRAATAAVICSFTAAAVALAATAGPVELISKNGAGQPVTDRGTESAISGNGRYVALSSDGRDLDPADLNAASDIFIKDRQTGTIERITHQVTVQGSSGASTLNRGALSRDGRFVTFTSTGSNFGPHDVNTVSDIYVYDRNTDTYELASQGPPGLDANGRSFEGSISADGRFVVFTSEANTLVPPDTNKEADVFLHDRQTGITSLISKTPAGLPGNRISATPAISPDGTKVAFASAASDLVPNDTNGITDVFVRDLGTGDIERVSVSSSEVEAVGGESYLPFMSGDGRYVGFTTFAKTLGGVRYGSGTDTNIYIRDTQLGTTERILPDVTPAPPEGSALEQGSGTVKSGWLSEDGRLVAFHATYGFTPGDGGQGDVFVLDRATDRYTVISRTPSGAEPAGPSFLPQISLDGTAISFGSKAKNLTTGGDTYNNQIYARPWSIDAVTSDEDGDGIENVVDNCPRQANPGQEDADGDGRGNICDLDDDADALIDPWEVEQNSDPLVQDTDGDGQYGDRDDDYPADPTKKIGTEHQTDNHAHLCDGDGKVSVYMKWKADTKQFETTVTGRLLQASRYTVAVYRRGRFIKRQEVTAFTTDALGVARVTTTKAHSFFTHIELLRGNTVVDTVYLENNRASTITPPAP